MRICDYNTAGLHGKDQLCIENTLDNSTMNYRECNCPLECLSTEFSFTTSTAEYPTLWYFENILKKLVKKNLSYKEMRESVARVEIGFAHMDQTVITEEKKVEVNDVISSIGGTLGLFLGFSFLSVVELVEIVVQSVLIFVFRQQNDKELVKF